MKFFTLLEALGLSSGASAGTVKVGDKAPLFTQKMQDGTDFKLEDRKGKGWTVLFFYPKAGTPGCTKQACAFRDSVKVIRNEGAEVYGISSDTVASQKKFHEEHKLTFSLIADPKVEVINAYDVKMPVVDISKRWTFIIDDNLIIRDINDNVDPVMDAKNVADKLAKLKTEGKKAGVRN